MSVVEASVPSVTTGRLGRCTHCGEPVRPGAHADPRFCCAGCAAVWKLLHDAHLEHAYDLHRQEGILPPQGRVAGVMSHLDHAAFQARHVEHLADGAACCEFRVDGVRCGACLWLLESLPRLVPGTRECRVHLGRGTLRISWRPEHVPLSTIASTIESLGYALRPVGTPAAQASWRVQDRAWLVDIGVAGAIAGNTMAIAFALYGAQFAWMDDATRAFLQWTSLALSAISIAWPGRLYLRNAWQAIRSRTPHMDLPITVALLAGLVGGFCLTIAGRAGIYVESVSMLVFLLLVGRFVQFRQQRRSRHEVELLCALIPQVARRRDADGSVQVVPTDALSPGDVVLVGAGDALPADGTLLDAYAHLDMQLLTGESRPVRCVVGQSLHAGTVVVGAPLSMRVMCTGDATRAGRIARAVDTALGERTPVEDFANRIAGWFLLVVVVATVVTGFVWWWIDASRVLPTCMALLVVSCPCALGLATPLTMVAGIGKAARRGMLVRGAAVFESLARPGTVMLDKTGTLTEGSLEVLAEHAVREIDPHWIRRAIGAIEAASSHPIAVALRRWAREDGRGVTSRIERAGEGLAGSFQGRVVVVGNAKWMERCGVRVDPMTVDVVARVARGGATPILVAVDGLILRVLALGDRIRPEAARTVQAMRARGWQVRLASGDLPEVAHEVALGVGIEIESVRAGCSPEDKMAWARAQTVRPVVVVGDGVNDLPAMAVADVGVAMRQGAQCTIDRADVTIAGQGLDGLIGLVDGSRRVMRTIHVNFAVSLTYNLIGAVLAVTGTITPLIAAVMMPLSGIMVTAIALHLPDFKERHP